MQSASWKQSNSPGTACQDSSEHSLQWILRHGGRAVCYWHCCHGCGAEELLGVCITRTPGPLQLHVTSVPSALLVFVSKVALTIMSSTFAALLSRDHSLCQTLIVFVEQRLLKHFPEMSKMSWACCSWFGTWGWGFHC